MSEPNDPSLVLYYAPRTRSLGALWLLEELGMPYRLESGDLATGWHKKPEHLARNPMGKVPVVVDRGLAVSELGAIAIYLADRYPSAGLAPAIDDPDRAAFLRWVFFASAVLEPALAERFNKWTPNPRQHAWGSFDQMLDVAAQGVSKGPYALGVRCRAAECLVGAGPRLGTLLGAPPEEGALRHYVARLTSRDAFVRASAIEARESERFPMKRG